MNTDYWTMYQSMDVDRRQEQQERQFRRSLGRAALHRRVALRAGLLLSWGSRHLIRYGRPMLEQSETAGTLRYSTRRV